tara:strand:- start:4428 stop:4634 length:207 start_codon:yes stop_codon:yes gene_type:complete
MSIKLIVESIETARVNNGNSAAAVEGKLNELIREKNDEIRKLEDMKRAISTEFEERDRDLVRLMEGAA